MVKRRLNRFYPNFMENKELCRTLDKFSAVNIVDKETDGNVGGDEELSFPSEFPAGELPDEQDGAAEGLYRRPRAAEIGQDLNTLVTEQEKGKVKQKDTQHGMWNESYSNDNQFEDADLKLGENDNEGSLEDAVYPPYSEGNGPIDSRYEDTDKKKYNVILHASQEIDPDKEDRQLWICIDLDGTILSKPEEYQDEKGNQLFGEPLPGAADALREMIDGGARVSIYTARQYFDEDESQVSKALSISPNDLLEFQLEECLIENDIPFSDIYIGKKPPAHFFVDDRTIPPFEGDWDLVLDAVRDKLDKKANDPIKDQVDYQGIKIDIEWPKGSIRSYEGQDTYVTHMKADYGYARGIKGNDGEELDIYLVDRESPSSVAYIIEQLNEEGNYDEDKIVLGATSEGEAAEIYLQHMPGYMLGDIREVPIESLVNALYGQPEDRRGEESIVPSEEKIIQAMFKNSTKTWPEDDIFENEYTDGTEDRENRDIPRPPEDENAKNRNAEIGGSK